MGLVSLQGEEEIQETLSLHLYTEGLYEGMVRKWPFIHQELVDTPKPT